MGFSEGAHYLKVKKRKKMNTIPTEKRSARINDLINGRKLL